jgi:hypothetical protein
MLPRPQLENCKTCILWLVHGKYPPGLVARAVLTGHRSESSIFPLFLRVHFLKLGLQDFSTHFLGLAVPLEIRLGQRRVDKLLTRFTAIYLDY